MTRPELPSDLKEVKLTREKELKKEMFRNIQNKLLEEIFSMGAMAHIDIALGVDRKAILKEVLIEFANGLDDFNILETSENTD